MQNSLYFLIKFNKNDKRLPKTVPNYTSHKKLSINSSLIIKYVCFSFHSHWGRIPWCRWPQTLSLQKVNSCARSFTGAGKTPVPWIYVCYFGCAHCRPSKQSDPTANWSTTQTHTYTHTDTHTHSWVTIRCVYLCYFLQPIHFLLVNLLLLLLPLNIQRISVCYTVVLYLPNTVPVCRWGHFQTKVDSEWFKCGSHLSREKEKTF